MGHSELTLGVLSLRCLSQPKNMSYAPPNIALKRDGHLRACPLVLR